MHRSLRAGGVLIDRRASSGTTRVGQLEYSQDFNETIAKAERSLDQVATQGLFERQRSIEYRFLIHFQSIEDWQEYFDYWATYYVPMSEELMQIIEKLASQPGADIVLDANTVSTAYKVLN
ncbi:MAG TPA: hypothetical protein EYQ61_09330 [Dehalococcoidia bacterium]|jgi:hypothetical protein|nr:hypothetical protein [Dehalococcoidia bacterium]HIK88035.1 hypothetical protein [Dehalococcoidia bacterium]